MPVNHEGEFAPAICAPQPLVAAQSKKLCARLSFYKNLVQSDSHVPRVNRFAAPCILVLSFVVLFIAGCAQKAPRNDFAAIFSMVATAEEALESFLPPKKQTLQDGMIIYTWEGRKEVVTPAHSQYVRSRWPRRDGFFEYYEVWVPDATHVLQCDARIITDPEGFIVYRAWGGNACGNMVRNFPVWYDRENPGVRKVSSQAAPVENVVKGNTP